MELRPYQRRGAAFLHLNGRALLADDMGLGKTAQAVVAAKSDIFVFSVMVVCPASVVENWKREFDMWWPDRDEIGVNLRVVSYNKAVRPEYQKDNPDVLILDEAHYLKNYKAKRTKAILGEGGLAARSGAVYALTGTPMPNNPSELWPLLQSLAPQTIENPKSKRPYSYWQFVKKFCKTRDNGFGTQITGGKNLDDLKQRLEGFMLRRLKKDVAEDLPPIEFGQLYVEAGINDVADLFTSEERQEYLEQYKLVADTLKKEGVEGLAKIASHVATLRRLTGVTKVKPVVEYVRDWLDGTDGKIVLFAWHRDVMAGLMDAMPATKTVWLTGAQDQQTRQQAVDLFQNDPDTRIFIGQIQAAGTGITLTAASNALFVESSWVPADNQQAAMRIHRIGQTEPCLVQFATLSGSIDDQVMNAVRRKTADITQLLG